MVPLFLASGHLSQLDLPSVNRPSQRLAFWLNMHSAGLFFSLSNWPTPGWSAKFLYGASQANTDYESQKIQILFGCSAVLLVLTARFGMNYLAASGAIGLPFNYIMFPYVFLYFMFLCCTLYLVFLHFSYWIYIFGSLGLLKGADGYWQELPSDFTGIRFHISHPVRKSASPNWPAAYFERDAQVVWIVQ